MIRENTFVEAMKFLKERNEKLMQKENSIIERKNNERKSFFENYYDIKETREMNERERNTYMEDARNNELATAIKGIYIAALEAETLTDEAIMLAESLVDNWIKEQGGASKIMRECKNKTYLLNRISEAVESAALNDLKAFLELDEEYKDNYKKDDDEEEDEEKEEDKAEEEAPEEKEGSEDKSDEDNKESEDDDSIKMADEDDEDEPEEEDDEDDDKDDDEEEAKEDDSVKMADNEDEPDEDDEDESEEDEEEVIDDEEDETPVEDDDSVKMADEDEPAPTGAADETEGDSEAPVSADPEDNDADGIEDEIEDDIETDTEVEPQPIDSEVLKDLDQEEDVQRAVATIRQRVADAEETFIKNNAKDKEQINDLLAKISDNIKTVEDMADNDKEVEAATEESVRMTRRKIDDITNNRPLTIFEKFTRNVNRNILRDPKQMEQYISESGSIETEYVVETAKVMYGFLETLNTLQLAKVDEKYIEELFATM